MGYDGLETLEDGLKFCGENGCRITKSETILSFTNRVRCTNAVFESRSVSAAD